MQGLHQQFVVGSNAGEKLWKYANGILHFFNCIKTTAEEIHGFSEEVDSNSNNSSYDTFLVYNHFTNCSSQKVQ